MATKRALHRNPPKIDVVFLKSNDGFLRLSHLHLDGASGTLWTNFLNNCSLAPQMKAFGKKHFSLCKGFKMASFVTVLKIHVAVAVIWGKWVILQCTCSAHVPSLVSCHVWSNKLCIFATDSYLCVIVSNTSANCST